MGSIGVVSSNCNNTIYRRLETRHKYSLATVLSLLLVTFFQMIIDMGFLDFTPIAFLSIIPKIADHPDQIHRFITCAWLHANWIHVLGNILVIALAGVPLEQRMGKLRWILVYFLGLLGGNIAWVLTHPDSISPAIGASGAAFGILGAYMACWPNDRIEFPPLLHSSLACLGNCSIQTRY